MGAITGLLLLPFMAPVWGFRFIIDRIREEAEAVLRDEGRAFAELIDLSVRHSAGQLSDAQYAEQEAALLERLNSIREYRQELLHTQTTEAEEGEDWSPDDEMYDSADDESQSSFADVGDGEVDQ